MDLAGLGTRLATGLAQAMAATAAAPTKAHVLAPALRLLASPGSPSLSLMPARNPPSQTPTLRSPALRLRPWPAPSARCWSTTILVIPPLTPSRRPSAAGPSSASSASPALAPPSRSAPAASTRRTAASRHSRTRGFSGGGASDGSPLLVGSLAPAPRVPPQSLRLAWDWPQQAPGQVLAGLGRHALLRPLGPRLAAGPGLLH